MKKLLKMVLTLATSTTVPLTVVACGQQNLEATLNAIYKGETNYLIDDFKIPGKQQDPKVITTFTLSPTDTDSIAKTIATKAAVTTPITWYQNTLAVNEKCYNFNVTNGKKTVDSNNQWDVNETTQRFTINISYLVGTVASDKTFKATQKIDMSFNIKVGTSASDNHLKTWTDFFNKQSWTKAKTPITVDLTSLTIDVPSGVGWDDLDKKIVAPANDAITNAINNVSNWPEKQNVAWSVKGMNGEIVDSTNHKLKIELTVNCGDSQGTTASFYLQFIKN